MIRTARIALWVLISAASLAACAIAHAVEVALENAGLFGDTAARFTHSAQRSILDTALLLGSVALLVCFDAVLRAAARRHSSDDWLLQSLRAVGRLNFGKLFVAIGGLQLVAYTAGELAEQHTAGYAPSLSPLFGYGHETVIVVLIAAAIAVAGALTGCARWISSCARTIAAIAESLVGLVALPRSHKNRRVLRVRAAVISAPPLPVLATRIANRPPPVFIPLS